jgi:uncharacterized protein (TIGR03086 family)
MTEVSDRYTAVADGFTRRLDGAESHWTDQSPCEDWKARDVAAHVIRTNRAVKARANGVEPEAVAEDEDLGEAWRRASSAVKDALADSDKAGAIVGGMFGEQSFERLVGTLVCADTLVHTWDLARATGQDEHLDPEAVTAASEFLETLDDKIRAPGGFGPKIDPPVGADAQTIFLCFTGRTP